MTETSLELLSRVVLPQEVLSYFEIEKIERTATEIHLHLDEKMSDALKD